MENENIRNCKGSLVVFNTNKKNGLYVLQGNKAIEGSATIIVDHDRLILWHNGLGHILKKTFVELSMRGLLGSDKVISINLFEHYIKDKRKRVNSHLHNIQLMQSMSMCMLTYGGQLLSQILVETNMSPLLLMIIPKKI